MNRMRDKINTVISIVSMLYFRSHREVRGFMDTIIDMFTEWQKDSRDAG